MILHVTQRTEVSIFNPTHSQNEDVSTGIYFFVTKQTKKIMNKLEDSIKAKLNIKYSAAKQLIAEAKANLEITTDEEVAERQDEILDEATQIFEDDLLPDEQEAMRSSGEVKSDWKQRAAAAQRRERAQMQAEQQETTEEAAVEEEALQESTPEEGHQEPTGEVEEEVEEIVEEVVQEGDGGEGQAGETVTQTVMTQVAEDGTKTVTTRTTKKTVTEQTEGTRMVVCCTIL